MYVCVCVCVCVRARMCVYVCVLTTDKATWRQGGRRCVCGGAYLDLVLCAKLPSHPCPAGTVPGTT